MIQVASEYDSLIGYNTYDVTELVNSGANAMGAVLGQGWWCGQMTFEASNSDYFVGEQPALMAKLVLNYADGSSETIVSDDENWDYYNDGAVVGFKYFDLTQTTKLRIHIKGSAQGVVKVCTQEHGNPVAEIPVKPCRDVHGFSTHLTGVSGTQALFFKFEGKHAMDLDF